MCPWTLSTPSAWPPAGGDARGWSSPRTPRRRARPLASRWLPASASWSAPMAACLLGSSSWEGRCSSTSRGSYLEHQDKVASFRCAGCGAVALDLAAAATAMARERRSAPATTVTGPACGAVLLPPDDYDAGAEMECPEREGVFSLEEGSPHLLGGSSEGAEGSEQRTSDRRLSGARKLMRRPVCERSESPPRGSRNSRRHRLKPRLKRSHGSAPNRPLGRFVT